MTGGTPSHTQTPRQGPWLSCHRQCRASRRKEIKPVLKEGHLAWGGAGCGIPCVGELQAGENPRPPPFSRRRAGGADQAPVRAAATSPGAQGLLQHRSHPGPTHAQVPGCLEEVSSPADPWSGAISGTPQPRGWSPAALTTPLEPAPVESRGSEMTPRSRRRQPLPTRLNPQCCDGGRQPLPTRNPVQGVLALRKLGVPGVYSSRMLSDRKSTWEPPWVRRILGRI